VRILQTSKIKSLFKVILDAKQQCDLYSIFNQELAMFAWAVLLREEKKDRYYFFSSKNDKS
jgi:hypothetical protein